MATTRYRIHAWRLLGNALATAALAWDVRVARGAQSAAPVDVEAGLSPAWGTPVQPHIEWPSLRSADPSRRAPGRLILAQLDEGPASGIPQTPVQVPGVGQGGANPMAASSDAAGQAQSPAAFIAYLRQQATDLQMQIDAARQKKAALQEENYAMTKELDNWRNEGERLQMREERVADLLNKAYAGTTSGAADQSTKAPLMAALHMSSHSKAHHSIVDASGSQVIVFEAALVLIPVIAGVVVSIAVIQRYGSASPEVEKEKEKRDWKVAQSWYAYAGPVLRALRIAPYNLEISEIVVCMPTSGDLRINIQIGDGQELRTSSASRRAGAVITYPDRFLVPVRSSEGMCKCSLVDVASPVADEEGLAQCDFPIAELLGLAHRQHGEYCRFPLQIREHWDREAIQDLPYIGMRIRDISSTLSPSEASMTQTVHMKERPRAMFAA